MGNRFEQLAKEQDRRKKVRRFKQMIKQFVGYFIALVVVATAAYFGWQYIQSRQAIQPPAAAPTGDATSPSPGP